MSLSDKLEVLYTAKEVKEFLKLKNINSVYHLLKKEGIGRKIGKHIYVTELEIQVLIDK